MQASDLEWDERGLLPAVVQDARTGALLMLAWMNAEALELTRTTGLVHFYSRSRKKIWQKGETSGHSLHVREVRTDCDHDAIFVLAEPAGPTCHTGKPSCFFRVMDASGDFAAEDQGPGSAAVAVLPRLEAVLRLRRDSASSEKSYTKSLLAAGFPRIVAKIAEEQAELTDELPAGEPGAVVHEAADLLFHVMVGLMARDIPMDEVWRELGRRFGVSGHDEKASRGNAEPK